MNKWYGSLNNRVDENKQFCKEIEVGTGVTEFGWSDRDAYEVVKVVDQNHVFVREYDHIHVGDGQMDNNWKLVSNESNPIRELKKRYGFWNWVDTITKDSIKNIILLDDKTAKVIKELETKAEAKIYRKANISFGIADYHYDYEF